MFLFFSLIYLYRVFWNFKIIIDHYTFFYIYNLFRKLNYFRALGIYICLFLWLLYFGLMLSVGIFNGYHFFNARLIFRWFLPLPLSFIFGYITYIKIKINDMYKIIVLVTSLIIIFSFVFFILSYFNLHHGFRFIFPAKSFTTLNLSQGLLNLRQQNQTSLIFLLPFNIFFYYLSKNKKNNYLIS